MEPVLTPAEMRASDEATIAAGTPGYELMDRAAHACAVVVLRLVGGAHGHRVVVVAGKGNNGGDGIACAHHLARAGATVDCFLLEQPTGDAALHLERAKLYGGRSLRFQGWSLDAFARTAARADVAVDALFGTGFSGEPRGVAREAVVALDDASCPVVAVDVASGVAGVDGGVPGPSVRASVTVAIQALKVGHVVPPGAFRCGRLVVADIGIDTVPASAFVPTAADVAAILPALEPDTHKYRAGVVAVLAGSPGMTGAAVLATSGAMRAGAGLVFCGVPRGSLDVMEGAVVEAVEVPLPERDGALAPDAVDAFAPQLERSDVIAFGPGLGRGAGAVELARRVVATQLPLVVDGDGLWALGRLLGEEPKLLHEREHAVVVTPHAGEYTFLRGRTPAADRLADLRDAAAEIGGVWHLKGRRAMTASPDGRVWVNTSGNPGMATAGSGDVLTGVVAALVSQRVDPEAATWAAAWLHGAAGDVATSRVGARPLNARDIASALPDAVRTLRRGRRHPGRIRTVLEDPLGTPS